MLVDSSEYDLLISVAALANATFPSFKVAPRVSHDPFNAI